MRRSVLFGSLPMAALATCAIAQQPQQPARPAVRLQPMTKPQARQGPSQTELRSRRDKKLAKAVFDQADWGLDFGAVRERAAAEDKLILVYFTRSYSP